MLILEKRFLLETALVFQTLQVFQAGRVSACLVKTVFPWEEETGIGCTQEKTIPLG